MALTPYLKLQKPPFDSIPWDQAINGNMDILDSTIAQFLSVPGYTGTWVNATSYTAGQVVLDAITAMMWQCLVSHTSAVVPTTFAQDRTAHPTYWLNTTTAPVAPVDQHNVGRNLIHNPLFNVAQRGNGPFTATGYTLDRWYAQVSLDTVSITLGTLIDAQRAQIGDEEATHSIVNAFTGNAGASAFSIIQHKIEGVRRLGGKVVTVSFWAQAASGTPKLGICIDQFFGTGGSPSAVVTGVGVAVTLSTTYTRYSVSFAMPSVSGKVLGSNGDDWSGVTFWFSSGVNNAVRAGSIGVQSGTIQLWGVQLEIGSVATPLEKPDPRYDLANCQRFYQQSGLRSGGFFTGATTMSASGSFPVQMRAIPTITMNIDASTSVTGITLGPIGLSAFYASGVAGASVAYIMNITVNASADL